MAHGTQTWLDAKKAYVEGDEQADGTRKWPTLEDVATRYAIGQTHLRRTAATKGWKEERELFQQRIAAALREKRVASLAAKGAQFDGAALRIAELIMAQVEVALTEAREKKLLLGAGELNRMSHTVRVAHQAGRLAMGDTTEIQKMTTEVVPELDLTMLDDAELAQLEVLQRKMQGVAA